ncbi:hypothetical protein NQ317_005969 [Molorchus minor]|uniref:MPN domain-containing protein n=1 Tax=Molorchus minor TaxID=1323400 RepID=A0ABQ9ITI5_9CUCU|nr:hypothetical protein NQ317_005969 [Molorchus minor]
MSKDKAILLRVQSPEGTKRLEIAPSVSTSQLYETVHDAFDLKALRLLYTKRKIKRRRYLAGNNSPSGEPIDEPGPSTSSSVNVSRPTTSSISYFKPNTSIKEDEVDLLLYKMDGKIERKRDDKLCRHNSNSRCVHCSPLEAFDEAYLREHNIKHISFHSYLRKLMSGVDRGKFVALEDISCRIKNGCKDHPPWPKGICSKCQPNAITLNMQSYRHVDNVMFENTNLVERFLNYWRVTGHQRIGLLYGTYEIHTDVPLGIRANVVAIYEPPQESTRDSIRLLTDDREEIVENLAASLGLRQVGWIFTDLLADDIQKGTCKHTRNIESHFLSAQECIMAGQYQELAPQQLQICFKWLFWIKICYCVRYRYISAIITQRIAGDTLAKDYAYRPYITRLNLSLISGDKANQVHMEGYQVSNQCMALVRDNCLLPTKDVPELGYVRESSDKQYVPDVYYKVSNFSLSNVSPLQYFIL